jgi:hypothetical protein
MKQALRRHERAPVRFTRVFGGGENIYWPSFNKTHETTAERQSEFT